MKIEETCDGEIFVHLSEREIIRAIYLHYNFPRSSKVQIVISPDKKDKLAAVIKIQ